MASIAASALGPGHGHARRRRFVFVVRGDGEQRGYIGAERAYAERVALDPGGVMACCQCRRTAGANWMINNTQDPPRPRRSSLRQVAA
jgi:hypothetical protein